MDRKEMRFGMRTDGEFERQIDDWRRRQPAIPSRAEAIRQLILKGLEADGGQGAPGNG